MYAYLKTILKIRDSHLTFIPSYLIALFNFVHGKWTKLLAKVFHAQWQKLFPKYKFSISVSFDTVSFQNLELVTSAGAA